MGEQVRGIVGQGVDRMIRRAVRKAFRAVYWTPPANEIPKPAVLVVNHHGWHDGYLMYHAVTKLGLPSVDWIQEFDSFPLFGHVGGMPFPAGDPARRAATIRKTIRLMNEESKSLILFAEGVLHRPPELMPFGKSLSMIANKTPASTIIPVAIRYDMALHERPEAYLSFGAPLEKGPDLAYRARLEIARMLDRLAVKIAFERESLQVLCEGTKDVNERLDFRSSPFGRRYRT
jgi:1-acyl-sn-glycerol-3-phosphate acyltransferase